LYICGMSLDVWVGKEGWGGGNNGKTIVYTHCGSNGASTHV